MQSRQISDGGILPFCVLIATGFAVHICFRHAVYVYVRVDVSAYCFRLDRYNEVCISVFVYECIHVCKFTT